MSWLRLAVCAALAFALGFGLLASPAMAQDGLRVHQSPVTFMPGLVTPAELTVVEDETVVRMPLRWSLSVRLAEPVTITQASGSVEFAAGTLLPKVRLVPGPGEGPERNVYCTPFRVMDVRGGNGFLVDWLNEMAAGDAETQVCLEDSDADRRLDRALAIIGREQVAELGPVGPLAFTELRDEAMDAASGEVRINLLRVARDRVAIGLSIVRPDQTLVFATFSSGQYNARGYAEIRFGEGRSGSFDMVGLRFQVLSADRDANRASLAVAVNAPPEAVIVVPTGYRPG